MVWWLEATFAPGPGPFYFTQPGTYTVGRKDCTIVVQTDKTISRLHAEITIAAASRPGPVSNNDENSPQCECLLKDNSKFGTYVNKEAGSDPLNSSPNKTVLLKEGDVITFGVNQVAFRVHFLKMVLCMRPSMFGNTNDLRSSVEAVGGSVVERWNDRCTHLLVEENSEVTDIVVAATLSRKPILRLEWLQVFMSQKSPIEQLPTYSSYLPTLSMKSEGGQLRASIAESHLRERILEGYTIFLKEGCVYKRSDLAAIVRLAGGTATLFTSQNFKDLAGTVQEKNLLVFPADRGSCKSWLGSKLSSSAHHLHTMNEDVLVSSILAADIKLPLICLSPDAVEDSDETVDLDESTDDDDAGSSRLHENVQAAESKPTLLDSSVLEVEESEALRFSVGALQAQRVPDTEPDGSSKLLEQIVAQHQIRVAVKSDNSVPESQSGESSKRSNKTSIQYLTRLASNSTGSTKPELTESHQNQPAQSIAAGGLNMPAWRSAKDASLPVEIEENIIVSSELVVRTDRPESPSGARSSEVPNFKRFKKGSASSGNSYSSLVPFSNEPYRESDYAREVQEHMRQEKKRKEAESLADELFNAEKLKRSRGAAAKEAGESIFRSRRH